MKTVAWITLPESIASLHLHFDYCNYICTFSRTYAERAPYCRSPAQRKSSIQNNGELLTN